MNKENENIHLFIIEEEYKRNKAKQKGNDDLLKKPEPLALSTQNHEAVIQELEKMHPNYKVIEEPKARRTVKRRKQVESPQIAESSNTPDILELLESFQKMKTEEQELLEQKQNLLTTIQNLHNKLIEEIDRKKTAINNLKTEIPELQNKYKKIAQALGIPVQN